MTISDADAADMKALQATDDERALDRLMARHKEALFGFICRSVQNTEDARELLVETFARVWFKRASFKAPGRFKPWLYQIAVNLCRDRCRRRWRWQNRVSTPVPEICRENPDGWQALEPQPDPARDAVSGEAMARLQAAIAALPVDLRTALVLYTIEQYPQAECAEILGISPKAVETRVYRARRQLAALLAREEPSLLSRPLLAHSAAN